MEKKDLMFTISFVISLIIMLYFLGSSITGYVVQSMHCDEGVCMDFCRYNSDCINENEICCRKGDFGVCAVASECEEEYKFQPKADVPIDLGTQLGPAKKNNIIIYSVITLLIIIIGIIYFLGRKKLKK